jgi:hypothetical protein
MVNALIGLECTVKERDDGLVIGDVDGVEGGSRRLRWKRRVPIDGPLFAAFLAQSQASGGIGITDADMSSILATKLDKTSSDSIGTTYRRLIRLCTQTAQDKGLPTYNHDNSLIEGLLKVVTRDELGQSSSHIGGWNGFRRSNHNVDLTTVRDG